MRTLPAGHTNSKSKQKRASKAHMKLSTLRAKVVMKELLKEGVHQERLVARGYGATRPLFDCGSEVNQRVEFTVIDAP